MRADVWGCLRCIGVFALLLLTPGLCVAWAGDVAGFRRQGAMGQLLWSVALSFAVVPIAAVMAAKYWSMDCLLYTSLLDSNLPTLLVAPRPQLHRFRVARCV